MSQFLPKTVYPVKFFVEDERSVFIWGLELKWVKKVIRLKTITPGIVPRVLQIKSVMDESRVGRHGLEPIDKLVLTRKTGKSQKE